MCGARYRIVFKGKGKASMKSKLVLSLLLGAPLLGGCVASLAASAVGMAVRSAQGEPESNQHLAPQAASACTERAAQHGTVKIIDVEQRSVSKMIVWGTVEANGQRQSFECGFGTKITSFKLRPIEPGR